MKKALVVFLAGLVVLFAALPAFAADLKFNGDFRIRAFYHENITDAYDTGTTGAPCAGLPTNCNDAVAYSSMRFLLTTTASAGLATGVVTLDFTSQSNSGNLRLGGGGAVGSTEPDIDRKSTRLNSSHSAKSRMPSSA